MLHKKVIIRPREKPWMTCQIRTAVRKRDRLLKTYSKCKSPTSWDRYRVQRNLVVSLVRKATICRFLLKRILGHRSAAEVGN